MTGMLGEDIAVELSQRAATIEHLTHENEQLRVDLATARASAPVAIYVELDYDALCDDCRCRVVAHSAAWHLSGRLLCRPCADSDEWAGGGL